jgi:hypothetical protein
MTTPHDLEVCFRDMIGAAAEAIGLDVSAMLRDTERVRCATLVRTDAVLERRAQARPADRRAVFVDSEMVAQVDGEIPSAAMRGLLERGAWPRFLAHRCVARAGGTGPLRGHLPAGLAWVPCRSSSHATSSAMHRCLGEPRQSLQRLCPARRRRLPVAGRRLVTP